MGEEDTTASHFRDIVDCIQMELLGSGPMY